MKRLDYRPLFVRLGWTHLESTPGFRDEKEYTNAKNRRRRRNGDSIRWQIFMAIPDSLGTLGEGTHWFFWGNPKVADDAKVAYDGNWYDWTFSGSRWSNWWNGTKDAPVREINDEKKLQAGDIETYWGKSQIEMFPIAEAFSELGQLVIMVVPEPKTNRLKIRVMPHPKTDPSKFLKKFSSIPEVPIEASASQLEKTFGKELMPIFQDICFAA